MENESDNVEIREITYEDNIAKKTTTIHYYLYDNVHHFSSAHVTRALQYKKNSQLSNAKNGILKDLRFEEHIYKVMIGKQERNFLDEYGLTLFMRFCSRTHKIPVDRLSTFLIDKGMLKEFRDSSVIPLPTKESSCVECIRKATYRFESETSYFIKKEGKNRKIDLYYPKQKLAIEIDENGHRYYDKKDEEKRDQLIKDLGIITYRFNPDASDFDIFTVIGDVLDMLYRSRR